MFNTFTITSIIAITITMTNTSMNLLSLLLVWIKKKWQVEAQLTRRTEGVREAEDAAAAEHQVWERLPYWQPAGPNPLDRRDDFSGPALRHGNLNSLFQASLYMPFSSGNIH